MSNIAFISTWLHRGAAYVTINYMKMLRQHKLFVYARGGEYFDDTLAFNGADIYKAKRLGGTKIDSKELIAFINEKNIDIIITNEQDEVEAVCRAKLACPKVIFGAYIDYYTEKTVINYTAYDFLLCNTKRHFSVFEWHPQCYYLPWCVDTDLYKPSQHKNDSIVFFHSMGMSTRKGTKALINTFIKHRLGTKSKLIIHTQKDISNLLKNDIAQNNNIEIIHKTVSAPGLYHMADVYVYPTTLDGLGLTMYEALSCGMPVIATNDAPMNEIISNKIGRLVKVNKFTCRSDGYYWPLAHVCEENLFEAMNLYTKNRILLTNQKENARKYALNFLNMNHCKKQLDRIIEKIHVISNKAWCQKYLEQVRAKKYSIRLHEAVDLFLPMSIESRIRERCECLRKCSNL